MSRMEADYVLKISPDFWTNANFHKGWSNVARYKWLEALSANGFDRSFQAVLPVGIADEWLRAGIATICTNGELALLPVSGIVALRTAEFERTALTKALRTAVMDRDGELCRICGAGAPLHVDHIWPVSRGGRSEIDNLWVLCRDCNLRKRDKPIDDFLEELESLEAAGELEVGQRWVSVVNAAGRAYKRARDLNLVDW